MTKKDELKLMGTISQLKLEDLSPSRRKRSLRAIELVQIIDVLDLSDDKQLLKAVMLATGHDGLLRTAELLFGSKVNNILWEFDRYQDLKLIEVVSRSILPIVIMGLIALCGL